MADDPLLPVAAQLYALPPEEFVAARTRAVRDARAAGDRELARRVGGLRKPAVAAWVVNQLVRRRPDDIDRMLEVGRALRAAQADLDAAALRDLGRQRRRLTAALARDGRALSAELGRPVSDQVTRQVEETLHAAMVSAQGEAAVRAGLLAEPLDAAAPAMQDSGGSAADVVHPGSAAPAGQSGLRAVPDTGARLDAARAELARAEEESATAAVRRDKAAARVGRRQATVLKAQSRLEEVRRRLAELENALEQAGDALEDAEARRDKAERRARAAASAEQSARAAVERLSRRA